MTVKISCPQCAGSFSVAEAFPGSRLFCPLCQSCLIFAPQITTQETTLPHKQKSPVATVESAGNIQKQAIMHLSKWLDISFVEIENCLNKLQDNSAYTQWKIPKGNGDTFREINAPCEPLKNIQRRILDRLLYRVPVSNASHGFVPGRSIVTNAEYHLTTAGSVLNLDLKDAFPSVAATRVKQLYVRYLKIPLKHLGEDVAPLVLDQVIDSIVKLTTYQSCLPQGGPCSGYLLNLACITLDKSIYRILNQHGMSYRYTRYADDITISSPTTITEGLQKDLQKIVHNCGFQINPKKFHYADRSKGQMLEVTGLILEKGKVRIPAEKLEIFRAIIHQAAALPVDQLSPEKRVEIQSVVAFVKMVYKKLPHRIWTPYKDYMEKHGIAYPKHAPKTYLDLYPD